MCAILSKYSVNPEKYTGEHVRETQRVYLEKNQVDSVFSDRQRSSSNCGLFHGTPVID